jgi:hypothetical protein
MTFNRSDFEAEAAVIMGEGMGGFRGQFPGAFPASKPSQQARCGASPEALFSRHLPAGQGLALCFVGKGLPKSFSSSVNT